MRATLLSLLLSYASLLAARQQPNIVFIMSDDHDNDAISAYNPSLIQTRQIDRLAKEGMLFNRAFVGNSICAPARATLLTGQHSHLNGVRDNRTPFDSSRNHLGKLLQQAGYQTALIGKWHLHSYPSGFNYWRILPGMGQYFDTRMILMNGDTITEKGYSTDVISRDALNWLDERKKNQPFALFLHHKAPHRYFFPALKQLELTRLKTYPEPASLYTDTTGRGAAWRMQTMSILPDMELCSDLKVDPAFLMDIPEYRPDSFQINYYKAIMRRVPPEQRQRYEEIFAERGRILRDKRPMGRELLAYKYQWYMQDYLACIASVDESVGEVLDYLDQNGLSKNTIVVYTSDQGFYLGENGWFDKRFAYDVSMQTPLIVRWPGITPAGSQQQALVQNIDFAPTLLAIAGVATPHWMQGVSLKPLLQNPKAELNRPYLYYHYYEYVKDHTVIPHVAIRGKRYKLIHFYTVDEWQLYDLEKDPGELHNRAADPAYSSLLNELKLELEQQKKKYKDENF